MTVSAHNAFAGLVRTVLSLGAMVLVVIATARAQVTGTCDYPVSRAKLNVNNVNATISNYGGFHSENFLAYEQPAETGLSPIFAQNLWVGGLVEGEVRTIAGRFAPNDLWAGPIFPGVTAPPNCDEFDRIYSISRGDIARYEAGTPASKDLREWPTGLGAPTIDADGLEIILNADGVLEHVDSTGSVVFQEPLSFEERLQRKIDLAAGERPKLLGDQMLWWIMNDVGNVHDQSGSPPLGMEIHGTAFAFAAPGVVGNLTFHRFRLLYKGQSPLDSAYVSVYLDTDLGDSEDDYVGVDTLLGLGYTYNGSNEDFSYGTPPPAFGVDFFQGPTAPPDGIDNDKDGEIDETGERLQMTSFLRLINRRSGGQEYEFDPNFSEEFYNVMRGRWRDGAVVTVGGDGRGFTTEVTTFQYAGRPELGEYWSEINTDGAQSANRPADRRFTVSSGPFHMESGDSEEIVYGFVWSKGDDHLDSIRQLREDDLLAQQIFDIDFAIAPPPAAPQVSATALDGRIILEWEYLETDNNYLNKYREVDKLLSDDVPDNDYVFEGYNVFQYSGVEDRAGELIAVYDVPNGVTRVIEGAPLTFVSADGSDNGVQQHHVVEGLTNYQTYYFGVQAYAYNETSGRKVYPGPVARIEAIPGRVDNRERGTILRSEVGETVEVVSAGGASRDAVISVSVANPAEVPGHDYEIEIVEIDGATAFDITDLETGDLRFDGSEYLSVTGLSPLVIPGEPLVPILIDGLSFSISGFTDCTGGVHADGESFFNDTLDSPLWFEAFLGPPDADPPRPAAGTIVRLYSDSTFVIEDVDLDGLVDTVRAITEAAGPDGQSPCPDPNAPYCLRGERLVGEPFRNSTNQWTVRSGSGRQLLDFAPNTFEIRFVNGFDIVRNGFSGVVIEAPLQVWDIGQVGLGEANDPEDDVQLASIQLSVRGGQCDWGWNEGVRNDGSGFSDFLFARYLKDPLDYPEYLTSARSSLGNPMQPGDRYLVETAHLAVDRDQEEAFDLAQIGIVPNPYRGASAYEVTQLSDEVRFTNMPEQATIRVFDLAGSLIRVMEKNSPESYFKWDLQTDTGLPIASGVYYIHIDVPNVGEHALKFAAVRKKTQLPIAR